MSVNLRELKQVGAKYSEKRRGRRMNSRVQVRLEWEGGGGKAAIDGDVHADRESIWVHGGAKRFVGIGTALGADEFGYWG